MVVANGATTADIARFQKGAGTDVVKIDSGGILHALNGLDAGSTDQFVVDATGNITAMGNLTMTGNLSVTGNISATGIGQSLFARKTADTTRTSTAARTADPHLTLAVSINATYQLEGYLIFDGSTAGDFAMEMNFPAGSTLNWGGYGQPNGASGTTGTVLTANMNGTAAVAYGAIGAGTKLTVPINGLLRTAGTSGNFLVSWAQSVSDATGTTLFTDSYIKLVRVA
jgi:hypothetical protein